MKRVLSVLLIIVIVMTSMVTFVPTMEVEASDRYEITNDRNITGEDILNEARKWAKKGAKYWSGTSPWQASIYWRTGYTYQGQTSFDCSGFVGRILNDVGYRSVSYKCSYGDCILKQKYGSNFIAISIEDLVKYGKNINAAVQKAKNGDYSDLRPGDVIGWTSRDVPAGSRHVIFYAGLNSAGKPTMIEFTGVGYLEREITPKYQDSFMYGSRWVLCDCQELKDYDSYGVCNNCKTAFNYESTKTAVSGIYGITKKISPSTTPYAATQDTSYTFEAGTTVELLGKYNNAWGNVWYKVSYGNGKTGFLYESYVTQVATETYPSFLMVDATKDTKVMSFPCSNDTNSASKKIATLKKGDYAIVYQMVKNVPGNYWYKVRTSDGDEGWIWCKETKVSVQSNEGEKVIVGNDLPATHTYGNTRYVDFNIQPSYAIIKSVTGAIYNGSATSGTAVFKESLNVNSKSISLKGSKIDNAMKFAQLSAGKQYTLVISAVLNYDYFDEKTQTKQTYEYTVSKNWTFTVSGGSTQPTITPATITEGTYYFSNDGYKMYMISDTSGKNNIGASNGTVSTKYQFNVVKDGSYYKIVPADGKNGYVLNSYWATGNSTKNGDEVTLYKNTGDPSQRWIFEKYGNGYLIHPADATNLSITREGNKLYIKTTTKAANQIWTLESPECSHTYDNVCDTSCNNCGATRTITHTFSSSYDSNENTHWKACTICGAITTITAHDYEYKYTSTGHYKKCTECYHTTDEESHDLGILASNSEYHLYGCLICDYTNPAAHVYENDCDDMCDICTETRAVTHTYDNVCDASCNVCGDTRIAPHHYNTVVITSTHHRKECGICGISTERELHYYSDACDESCDYCGRIRVPDHVYTNGCDPSCNACGEVREVSHDYEYQWGLDCHYQKCKTCGDTTERESHDLKMLGATTEFGIGHLYGCDICKYSELRAHVYDNDCDDTCDECGDTRNTTHKYDDVYDITCNVCGATRDFMPGDVNGDNRINGTDVALIRRYITGGYGVEIDVRAADVNNDGRVNGTDVALIRRYIAGGYGVELKPSTKFSNIYKFGMSRQTSKQKNKLYPPTIKFRGILLLTINKRQGFLALPS